MTVTAGKAPTRGTSGKRMRRKPDRALFPVGLSLLLMHEMDAVRRREWLMLPGLSNLRDETGYLTFTALHVPVYALLFHALSGRGRPRPGVVFGLDLFCVVHVLLHLLFVGRPTNRFRDTFSWALILGSGACGALDLLMWTSDQDEPTVPIRAARTDLQATRIREER